MSALFGTYDGLSEPEKGPLRAHTNWVINTLLDNRNFLFLMTKGVVVKEKSFILSLLVQ